MWEQTVGRSAATKADYERLKNERCAFLWEAVERALPDLNVRDRAVVSLQGSPLTHERFNRRYRGTFGPAIRAGNKEGKKFPYPRTDVSGLFICGDSVFPGIGVPAVAASGANAASSCVSVWEHLKMLKRLDEIVHNV